MACAPLPHQRHRACRGAAPHADAQTVLDAALPEAQHQALRALILDGLRRLHEGVLARYGLRTSQLQVWKDVQGL